VVGTLIAISADPFIWGVAFAIRPDIPETYYYEKGEHCIMVQFDRTFVTGYRQYMHSWKWRDKEEECGG
jgi:hypothetical protein